MLIGVGLHVILHRRDQPSDSTALTWSFVLEKRIEKISDLRRMVAGHTLFEVARTCASDKPFQPDRRTMTLQAPLERR